MLTGRTVLVTGASGFIGAHLCRRLLREGAEVHGVSRSGRGSLEGVRWQACDVSQSAEVRSLVRSLGPSVLFHLASHVSGSRALDVVLPTLHANLVSTVNVLTAAAETGSCRVVLAGSLEEPDPGAEPVPPSPYGAAKWASSGYGRMFHALYGVPVVLARIFMVYGPEQRNLEMLVPYTIRSLLRGKPPELASGRRPVDWIYVDDVVAGLLRLATAPGVEGKTLEIGSGALVTVRELVERIVALMGSGVQPAFGARPDRPLERVRVADAAATLAAIGWKPEVSLDEGLRRTIQWCESLR